MVVRSFLSVHIMKAFMIVLCTIKYELNSSDFFDEVMVGQAGGCTAIYFGYYLQLSHFLTTSSSYEQLHHVYRATTVHKTYAICHMSIFGTMSSSKP